MPTSAPQPSTRAELANPPTPPPHTADGSVKLNPDIMEVEEIDAGGADFDFADSVSADVALDAFVDGKKRPSHLDRDRIKRDTDLDPGAEDVPDPLDEIDTEGD